MYVQKKRGKSHGRKESDTTLVETKQQKAKGKSKF